MLSAPLGSLELVPDLRSQSLGLATIRGDVNYPYTSAVHDFIYLWIGVAPAGSTRLGDIIGQSACAGQHNDGPPLSNMPQNLAASNRAP